MCTSFTSPAHIDPFDFQYGPDGSLSLPAPSVLWNGNGVLPDRIMPAYTCPGSTSALPPRTMVRSPAAAPPDSAVAALVPPKVPRPVPAGPWKLLAVSTLVGATTSGLMRPSPVGPLDWAAEGWNVLTARAPRPSALRAC